MHADLSQHKVNFREGGTTRFEKMFEVFLLCLLFSFGGTMHQPRCKVINTFAQKISFTTGSGGRSSETLTKSHDCIYSKWTSLDYVSVYSYSIIVKKRTIVGPQEVKDPRFLLQLTLTHYILRSTFFRAPPTPPICLKMPKCAIFSLFFGVPLKKPPQSGGPP